jgi:mono/diheme cytochrome c family protein
MLVMMLTLVLASQPEDPGAHVREILATKCGQCHGAKVAHPKGKFGFITDLKRLAADPDYVVPGDPEGSYLWNQIDEGEMPPDEAKAGPLTEEETQAIQDWIKNGAVAPLSDPPVESDSAARGSDEGEREAAEPVRPRTMVGRLMEFVGKFHILTVHFPIALLAGAAMAELWGAVKRQSQPLGAVRFCLWLGAASAVASAGLGWLHAYYMTGEPAQLLLLHRWIGTGAGVLAPCIALLAEQDVRVGRRRMWVRWGIIGLGVLVGVAGHFGGMLVYGSNFLRF